MRLLLAAFALGAAACASAARTTPVSTRPLVDHHQHIFSPATHARASSLPLRSARDLIAQLDSVGIRRAVILSMAYGFARKPASFAPPTITTWPSSCTCTPRSRSSGPTARATPRSS